RASRRPERAGARSPAERARNPAGWRAWRSDRAEDPVSCGLLLVLGLERGRRGFLQTEDAETEEAEGAEISYTEARRTLGLRKTLLCNDFWRFVAAACR